MLNGTLYFSALSDEAALRQAAEHSQRTSVPPGNHVSPVDTSAAANVSLSLPGDVASPIAPDITRHVPRTTIADNSVPVQESRCCVIPKAKNPRQSLALYQSSPGTSTEEAIEQNALLCLYDKLQFATAEMTKSENVNHSIELCQLIQHSAEAIEALRKAQRNRLQILAGSL
jgi:hypothetical protein